MGKRIKHIMEIKRMKRIIYIKIGIINETKVSTFFLTGYEHYLRKIQEKSVSQISIHNRGKEKKEQDRERL